MDDAAREMIMTLLKRHRLAKGLSQQKLASRTKVSVACVSSWETGRSLPRAENIKKLARALGIDPYEITNLLSPSKTETPSDSPHPGE